MSSFSYHTVFFACYILSKSGYRPVWPYYLLHWDSLLYLIWQLLFLYFPAAWYLVLSIPLPSKNFSMNLCNYFCLVNYLTISLTSPPISLSLSVSLSLTLSVSLSNSLSLSLSHSFPLSLTHTHYFPRCRAVWVLLWQQSVRTDMRDSQRG